jgi:MFS family permease
MKLLTPLRHRDFRLLWLGMTVSLLGDGIFLVALAWQAYELSKAPTALALVGVAMTVPHVVLLLVGGVASDRFDRRRVMMVADGVRAIALCAMGMLAVAGTLRLWHMLVIAAVFGAGTAFFGPAFDAVVPELVPEEELPQANSLDQFVRPAASRLIGPALAGWTIALLGNRAGPAFIVDAATFAFSVICLLAMRSHPAERPDQPTPIAHEIAEGFRFVRSRVWLWGTFLAATLAYLIFWGPSEVLLPHIVKYELHESASDLGMILALGGVGAMASAIWMGNRSMPRRSMTFMYLVWTVSTIAIAGYGLAQHAWQLMAACFVFNALESAGTIVWATTKQRLVPARLLGRVSSFDWFISIGLVPVSFALTGPVAHLLGPRTTLVGAGVLGGAVTLAFLFVPGMRTVESELEQRAPEPSEPAEAELQRQLPPLLEAMMEPDPSRAAFALDPDPAPEISLREAFAAVAVADPEEEDPVPAPPAPRSRTRLGDTRAFPARG